LEKRRLEKERGDGRWSDAAGGSTNIVKKDLNWIKNKAANVLKDIIGIGKDGALDNCNKIN
jgi:hypothetical protein